MSKAENRVLTDDYRSSDNFYESDLILKSYLHSWLPEIPIQEQLLELGKQAATEMDALSQKADKNGPVLRKRDKFGNELNRVDFHPAYRELMDMAARSEMFHLKYHPETAGRYGGKRHRLGFALGQLYAMSELGQYCPHCMTDGAAYLIEQFGEAEDQQRLLPKLGARTGDRLYSGAMFLTEKSGGSDVGANLTKAEHVDGRRYKLNGEKWFCRMGAVTGCRVKNGSAAM